MDIFGLLILGLGLFFLGMHQVGENLRRMTGPSFRSLMARSTGSPVEPGVLGLVFGALMQSATAVTFILVSMVSSGRVVPRAALRDITCPILDIFQIDPSPPCRCIKQRPTDPELKGTDKTPKLLDRISGKPAIGPPSRGRRHD
jgi:hypothetical protein